MIVRARKIAVLQRRDIWYRKRIMDMENVVISKKGNIAAVFNEWARRFAENPGDFGPVVGDDGKLISDYGERCEAYFLRVSRAGLEQRNESDTVVSRGNMEPVGFESNPNP